MKNTYLLVVAFLKIMSIENSAICIVADIFHIWISTRCGLKGQRYWTSKLGFQVELSSSRWNCSLEQLSAHPWSLGGAGSYLPAVFGLWKGCVLETPQIRNRGAGGQPGAGGQLSQAPAEHRNLWEATQCRSFPWGAAVGTALVGASLPAWQGGWAAGMLAVLWACVCACHAAGCATNRRGVSVLLLASFRKLTKTEFKSRGKARILKTIRSQTRGKVCA